MQLLLAVEACESLETKQGLEQRRRIMQELDTLVKQWVRTEGMWQGLHWSEVERAGGKVVTYGHKNVAGLVAQSRHPRPAAVLLPAGS